jgi:hypothetical protein
MSEEEAVRLAREVVEILYELENYVQINDSGQRQLTSLLPSTSALCGVSWTSQQDTPPLDTERLVRATRVPSKGFRARP